MISTMMYKLKYVFDKPLTILSRIGFGLALCALMIILSCALWDIVFVIFGKPAPFWPLILK